MTWRWAEYNPAIGQPFVVIMESGRMYAVVPRRRNRLACRHEGSSGRGIARREDGAGITSLPTADDPSELLLAFDRFRCRRRSGIRTTVKRDPN